MNTKLRINAENDFEKDFFKLMNNVFYGKTMENPRNHRDIRVVTTDKRRSMLASEPNYHSTKYISKDLLIMEMRKTEVTMNKPIYVGQAILDISKTLMYEFWYDYIKQKYGDKARLILIALLCILKQKIFTKILQAMLKDGLIHLIIIKRIKDHFQ